MPERNPSPKKRFLENGKGVEVHNAVYSSTHMRHSIDVALLQYADQLGKLVDIAIEDQAACYNRLRGAHEFVNILMNLAEGPAAQKTNIIGNLQH